MARKQPKNSNDEIIVNVSSGMSERQLRKQARKDEKASEFHKSIWVRLFKNGVWPSLVPFVLVMICLVIIPLIAVIVTSLMGVSNEEATKTAKASLVHYGDVFTSGTIWKAIGLALGYALVASILCIVFGYPIAYMMAQLKSKILAKNIWVLVTMPIWISMLLKVLGLQTLFALLNPSGTFIGTPFCIIIGMVYMFIPFAIGPMYDSILVRDKAQEEAAKDLGCSGARVFFSITLRNTVSGMLTGFSLVIVQAATSLIAAHYLGGGNTKTGNLVPNIIENYFIRGNDWPMACAIAVVLTVLVFLVMLVISLASKRFESRKKGKNKWRNSERVVISHS